MALPVSIVIASWNRRADLETTLDALASIEPVAEIVVVDNGSTDGTAQMIGTRFPGVTLLRSHVNLGVPGFDLGFGQAQQPFVLLLDDDAIPALGCLPEAVRLLEAEPRLAVVACHIIDAKGIAVTNGWPGSPLCFWGCGAVVRRALIVEQPHLFDPRLRLHGAEMDLCIRLRACGHSVRYAPHCVVYHRFSPANRSEERRMSSLVPNALWFPAKYLPLRYAVPAATRHLAVLAWRAIRTGRCGAYAKGLRHAIRELPGVWHDRSVVPLPVARAYYRGVWEFEPLVGRLWRRVAGRLISRKARPRDFEDLAR